MITTVATLFLSLLAPINGHAPSLHPEGLAYDPARHEFLVSSLRHGTVSVVHRDGSVRTLVDDPALVSTVGIRIAGDRLYVANADPGVGLRTTPETQGRLAGLGIYDLRTGHRIRYVGLGEPGPHFANDIAVGPDGTAYVTDSFGAAVYRVPVNGEPSVLVRDARLGGESFGPNGIAWTRAGLVIGKYNDGTVWKVSAKGGLTQVRMPALPGADGFALHRDGSLTVVVNSLDGSGSVATVRPSRDWTSAEIVRTLPSADPTPTAAAVGPRGRTWVLSGRLNLLFAGTLSDVFTVRPQ